MLIAQQKSTGGISFTTENNQPFFLYLNDQLVNEQASVAVRAIGLKSYYYKILIKTPDKKYEDLLISKLYVCNNDGVLKETGYILKSGSDHFYLKKKYYKSTDSIIVDGYTNFIFKDGQYIPMQPILNSENEHSQIKANVESSQGMTANSKDSTGKKSTVKEREKSTVKQKSISTPPLIRIPDEWKCQELATLQPEKLNQMVDSIKQIKSQFLVIKYLKSMLGENCYLTAQIRILLQNVHSEFQKLELLKQFFPYTSDIGNYYQFSEDFQDGRNRSAFIKFITAW